MYITISKTLIILLFTKELIAKNIRIVRMDYIVFMFTKKTPNTFKMEDNFLGLTFVHLRQYYAIKEVKKFIILDQHERKTCLYYHNDRDKRRNPSY